MNELSDFADASKLEQSLAWAPEVGLDEGLSRTLEYFRARGEHYWEGLE